ncbi:helix-turn-helix domain-containing protein [Sphingomonas sp. JC676]|uniref:helix-turn-helix domain-containing protein n=1 Tax=Sphingomonas sp. JC676 TaxID=2768065 RepID=UPI001CA64387|nr:helix-turn-helix transcriptional regulator [Sphingomonas sp. JC676]
MKSKEERADIDLLSAALKGIRRDRRMRSSEVARAMGMPLRSYEHFESGRGRFTFDRLVRFAEVTNSDALAIIAVLALKSPEFALRCADNKLMTIFMIAMSELNEELGDDITFLEPGILIGAFTRVAKDLSEHIAKRDLFAETWLKERSSKIQGARPLEDGRLRRRPAD